MTGFLVLPHVDDPLLIGLKFSPLWIPEFGLVLESLSIIVYHPVRVKARTTHHTHRIRRSLVRYVGPCDRLVHNTDWAERLQSRVDTEQVVVDYGSFEGNCR